MTTIQEIYLRNETSKEAFDVCFDNEIESIEDLKQYQFTHGSFDNFRNCSKEIRRELKGMCLEYDDHVSFTNDDIIVTKNWTSEDSLFTQNLNQEENEGNDFARITFLNSLSSQKEESINNFISKTYNSNLSFKSRRTLNLFIPDEINIVGFSRLISKDQFQQLNQTRDIENKARIEIENYLTVLKSFILQLPIHKGDTKLNESSFKPEKLTISDKIEELDEIKQQIINDYILVLTSKLSTRTKNAFVYYLERELDINNFSRIVFSDNRFIVKIIQNLGLASQPEIEEYLTRIKQFSIRVIYLNDAELKKLQIKIRLNKIFKGFTIPYELIETNSIFKLMDDLINKNSIFKKEDSFIIINTFNVYTTNKNNSLEYVSEIIGSVKESIRKRRIRLVSDISLKFKFLNSFEKSYLAKYNLDFGQGSISISEEKAASINGLDNTHFSKEFILLIISFLVEEEFQLIGNKSDVLLFRAAKVRDRYYWKNIYLIKNELVQVFNFENYIEDIDSKIKKQNDTTYKLNFKSYLEEFFKTEDLSLLEEVFPICLKLLKVEFKMNLDPENNIVFERNIHLVIHKYALEALEVLGKPSHVNEINEQIKKANPNFNSLVRGNYMNRLHGFVPYGRTNTFGLKKWDTEKINVKGGTIRSITEEYLQNYAEPVKLNEVVNYVLKYRPDSNKPSIITNLKVEKMNTFIFFKGTLIGLRTAKYPKNLYQEINIENTPKLRTWKENYQDLLNFILEKDRFPSRTNTPQVEKSLYTWFTTQAQKINNNLLNETKTNLILDIKNTDKSTRQKNIQFYKSSYYNLFNFIERNKRLPKATEPEELFLHNFYNNQSNRFDQSELKKENELKFFEVKKLIQLLID